MLDNVIEDRLKKFRKYKELFHDPYPSKTRRDAAVGGVFGDF